MQNQSLHNVTVIIRSAYERTEETCRKLISAQGVPEEQLFTIHEVPFSAALKKSFNIGLRENRKWTFCIDADVLLRPGSIKQMVEIAEKQKSNVCEIQGFVMDKFFGGPRQAGNHLYRTRYLDVVTACIPEEGVNIRPENYALNKMVEKGYKWKPVRCIVGLHDDKQFYFDIYRKAYVHGIKHLDRAELLINHWKKNANRDHDFNLALKAFSDSIANTREAYINRNQLLYKENFQALGIAEKDILDSSEITPEYIEQVITSWEYPAMYFYYFPNRDNLDSRITGYINKIKRNYRKLGLKNFVRTALKKYM